MPFEDFVVCDADMHVMEPADLWQRYMTPEYRHAAPIGMTELKRDIRVKVKSQVLLRAGPVRPLKERGGSGIGWRPDQEAAYGEAEARGWDAQAQLDAMDREGVDLTVLFPTRGLFVLGLDSSEQIGADGLEPAFASAIARAYNDWLHDYCEVCPQRLKGIGLVALQDVEGAIEEMHRAMSRLNMVGIQIGCTVREDTLLSDVRLSPFWAEAERLNVPIAVHGPALPSLFRSYFDLNRPDHMLEASHMAHTFAQMLACSNIITGGVLERFSRLKIAFLEAGAGWVPYWMHRMDEYNEVAPERWAHISAKPSEYVKGGRVFFSCEPGDEFIPFFIDHVGEDAMLFASDYLHFDALFVGEPGHDGHPYPGTVATLLGRKDVPDSAKRKMLLDNSLNFYSMDRAKLGRRGMAVARPEPEEARRATVPGTISAR